MATKSRGFAAVGLCNPRNEHNIGGALLACACYGVSMIAVSGKRYKPLSSDTTKAFRHIPMLTECNLEKTIPLDCIPVAVELVEGARSLIDYTHPERAFYIFGPEDGSLGKPVLDFCRDVVQIPTHFCMNLAATVNVVLYDRLVKRGFPN